MDIGCYKSAINRRPAIHTHAWFSNKHALTDAYAMTLNPKTSVPATSAQDMNKSSKKFRSQGARKELCRAGLLRRLFAFLVCTGLVLTLFDPVAYVLLPSGPVVCCVQRRRLLLFLRPLFPHLQLPRTEKYLHTRTHSGCLLAWPWQRLCLGHTMPSLLLPFTHHLSRARALQTRLTCAHISICSVIGANSGVCFHGNVGELCPVIRFGKICILSERNLSQRLLQICVGAITPILIVCLELSQQMKYCNRELHFYRTR